MKNILGALMFFGVIYLLYKITISFTGSEVATVRRMIIPEYVGLIIYKNSHRVFRFDIVDSLGKKERVSGISSELYKAAEIGDTIRKLPNSNKCLLLKNGRLMKINCYFIRESIKESFDAKIEEW